MQRHGTAGRGLVRKSFLTILDTLYLLTNPLSLCKALTAACQAEEEYYNHCQYSSVFLSLPPRYCLVSILLTPK